MQAAPAKPERLTPCVPALARERSQVSLPCGNVLAKQVRHRFQWASSRAMIAA